VRLRRFAAALFWVAAPLLAGCFQTSTLVKLKPDGSGTIELTTTVSSEGFKRLHDPGDSDDPFSISDARTAAAGMGTGVTFVSAARIDTPDRKGIKAVYAFKDIGTVSIGALNPPEGFEIMDKGDALVHFAFTRLANGHALLTIENPVDVPADVEALKSAAGTEPPEAGIDDKQVLDRMAVMLGGAKVDFAIEVAHLVKTNIPYVNGGRVTVLSLDTDQMAADPASVEKLRKAYSVGPKAVQDAKGIRISGDPKLTIEFRK